MGKLLDYANLGVDLYQTKQLATISSAQQELQTAHMLESMRGDMEVEKRQLIMQFETELESLNFVPNAVRGAAKVVQIRTATIALDLTISGFREFADMERAKSFVAALEAAEARMHQEVTQDDINNGTLVHQYVMEDDDLEEYAALQHVKEAEDAEMNLSMKAAGWLFGSGLIGIVISFGIAAAMGVDMSSSDGSDAMPDWVIQSCCGLSIVFMAVLWKPFGMSASHVQAMFSTDAMKEAKEILRKGGGQEALDEHISNLGEMTSEEVIGERIRRLEFVAHYTG